MLEVELVWGLGISGYVCKRVGGLGWGCVRLEIGFISSWLDVLESFLVDGFVVFRGYSYCCDVS